MFGKTIVLLKIKYCAYQSTEIPVYLDETQRKIRSSAYGTRARSYKNQLHEIHGIMDALEKSDYIKYVDETKHEFVLTYPGLHVYKRVISTLNVIVISLITHILLNVLDSLLFHG